MGGDSSSGEVPQGLGGDVTSRAKEQQDQEVCHPASAAARSCVRAFPRVFSPPATHARPSWRAGGGGTRSAPVAMRCGALTTPLRLQVGLDHKDADEQTFTEYCPHTFQALVFKQHPDPGEWARSPLTDRLVPRPCLRRDRMVAPVCERRGPAERGS